MSARPRSSRFTAGMKQEIVLEDSDDDNNFDSNTYQPVPANTHNVAHRRPQTAAAVSNVFEPGSAIHPKGGLGGEELFVSRRPETARMNRASHNPDEDFMQSTVKATTPVHKPPERPDVQAVTDTLASTTFQPARRSALRQAASPRHQEGLLVEDVAEDFDADFDDSCPAVSSRSGVRSGGTVPAPRTGGTLLGSSVFKSGSSIPPETYRMMKTLLWGENSSGPPPSWKQGLFFNCEPGLEFGLVQKAGGPCGVLAGVQAFVLIALTNQAGGYELSPSRQQQAEALTRAVSDILWQARSGPDAVVVAAPSQDLESLRNLSYDQLGRVVTHTNVSSRPQLENIVSRLLGQLMDEDGWGIILLLLSLLMTRGPYVVQQDKDEQDNSLMGPHGYCTQDLVNLVSSGTACSNVFDGKRRLDATTLRGLTRQCLVGFLTLFEWYKYVEVGSFLKDPEHPIWIVCSESHFTTLFALRHPTRKPFDLLYYDQLARQERVIKLSVAEDPRGGWMRRVGSSMGDRGKCDGQLMPPLELVIETKWPGVKVDWNGTDPIL